MISKESIDRIFDAVRIEEVVGDFVPLKKRGVNLIGLCPFHNEKTPSFNVNPVRNIYKCFGCGKGGSAVNFVMEHEHYSYPEALRFLARKYAIEIEETVPDPQEELIRDEKESLFILNTFAAKTFSENLFDTEEGRSIGLSYFKERNFTEETIRKFQLGYSAGEWSSFTELALKQGYKSEYLEKTGLSIRNDKDKVYDRFRGRVMFPIHNLSGRVIGFGGRVMKKDEKTAKYVNSPESEIYHKSKSLYGIYYAKKAIVQRDACYLVEGYTDVISLHQAGIENVVASSGTSLTVEQIRLISRYTKNITVLFDGDSAGIKASLRGINLILEEGLNVRVVLFPDGDDPDSYCRKHGSSEVADFISNQSKDFVVFKTGLLLEEVKNDPVRKAALIRDVVETIAQIPDAIIRATYLKQCSVMMDIDEQVLVNELNKIRRQQLKKEVPAADLEELMPETLFPHHQNLKELTTEYQERHIIYLLLNFGNHELNFYEEGEAAEGPGTKETIHTSIKVFHYIVEEIAHDRIAFENPLYQRILNFFTHMRNELGVIDPQYLLNSENPEESELAAELLSSKYFLSENWEAMHKIIVPIESQILKDAVEKAVFHLKNKKVLRMMEDNQKKIKDAQDSGSDYNELMEMHKRLESVKVEISKVLGIDVLR